MRKGRWLALILTAGIGLLGGQAVYAAGAQGGEALQGGGVTAMDEEGNIIESEGSAKLLEESGEPKLSRSGEPMVVNFRTKTNAITEYQEAGTKEPGYTNGAYGADGAYLGTEDGKVKFMLSGVVGLVAEEEVQVSPVSSAEGVSHYEVSQGKLLHVIVQDMTGEVKNWQSRLNNGPAPAYLEEGGVYYSYDGHYFYTDYRKMLEDYKAGNRENSVNPSSPFYNYYQYLPLRSRTVYTGEELNGILNTALQEKKKTSSLLENTGAEFVEKQEKYGTNALLMAGIAVNESAWGTSKISREKKNLFGLKAYDSSPGTSAATFETVSQCIQDFAEGWLSRGYLCTKDYRYKGGFLGNKASGMNLKYASDPYWGEKAANIAWSLDESQGGKDTGRYTLGIKESIPGNHTAVNVRKEASTDSASLYKTSRESNYAVLVLNTQTENGFYRIQSDPALSRDRSRVEEAKGEYDFQEMYAYIFADYISIVNVGSGTEVPSEKPEQEPGDEKPSGEPETGNSSGKPEQETGGESPSEEPETEKPEEDGGDSQTSKNPGQNGDTQEPQEKPSVQEGEIEEVPEQNPDEKHDKEEQDSGEESPEGQEKPSVQQPAEEIKEEPAPVLKTISVTASPRKTSYIEGESFDPSGMTVKAFRSDGSEEDVTAKVNYEKDGLSAGQTGIILRYTEGEATAETVQEIEVSKKAEDAFTLTQDKTKAEAGDSVIFTGQKNGERLEGEAVSWEVSGGKSPDTRISGDGRLEIGKDEKTGTLTVKAVLKEDAGKTALGTVEVKEKGTLVEGSRVPENKKPSAKTGDASRPALWLFLSAGALAIGLGSLRKKRG